MAKSSLKKITAVQAQSIAMYEGTFAAVLGLFVAVLHSLNTTVKIAESTNSTLTGLSFGLATGIVSLVVVPLVYFGLGYLVGYAHGIIFNAVAKTSGGIVVQIED